MKHVLDDCGVHTTNCPACSTYSGMNQDALDGAIAFDALLAERDSLRAELVAEREAIAADLDRRMAEQGVIKELLEALKPFAETPIHPADPDTWTPEYNTPKVPAYRKAAAVYAKYSKSL